MSWATMRAGLARGWPRPQWGPGTSGEALRACAPRMRAGPFLTAASTLALSYALPSAAYASPSYPAAVRDALGLPCAPACTLCHRDDRGGIGTAISPFATSARIAGLTCCNPAQLPGLLAQLDTDAVDSDDDGDPDIAEL